MWMLRTSGAQRRLGLLTMAAVLLGVQIALPARAQDTSVTLLRQVESALRQENAGPVHDLGHLLKPGGVRELAAQADRFKRDGVNVYYVTVPKGSVDVDRLAETVYRDLNGQPSDMLIVFDGQRVYGKTLALKGHREAFDQALEAARPGFRKYYAKGLAMFAEALRDQVRGAQGGASGAAVQAPPAHNPPAEPAHPPTRRVAGLHPRGPPPRLWIAVWRRLATERARRTNGRAVIMVCSRGGTSSGDG